MVAERTTATALHDLTAHDCSNAHPLKVSFQWRGHQVVADDQPDCGRDYLSGDQVTIFVASNAPSDIGPTEQWILDPSAHNPFDFIGPNGLPDFFMTLGLIATGVACTLMVKRFRRNRRQARCDTTSPAVGAAPPANE